MGQCFDWKLQNFVNALTQNDDKSEADFLENNQTLTKTPKTLLFIVFKNLELDRFLWLTFVYVYFSIV